MALPLLVDINIWMTLVSKSDFSNKLKALDILVGNKQIMLLCPSSLLEEWKKTKEAKKKELADDLKKLQQSARLNATLNNLTADLDQEQLDELSRILFSQIDLIDSLITQFAVKISQNDSVDLLIMNQRRQNKAPFHTQKKDNINDADIIFSSLHYVKEAGQTELYFISADLAQFCDGNTDTAVLHPDISKPFPEINIHYFKDIQSAFDALESISISTRVRSEEPSFRAIKNTIAIDTKRPMLFQIDEYLQKRFKDWEFIPKMIFIEHYPFIKEKYFRYHHRPFTLITDNKDVLAALTDVRQQDGVFVSTSGAEIDAESQNTYSNIFRLLFDNGIYKIGYKLDNPIAFHYSPAPDNGKSLIARHRNLDFSGLINELYRSDQTDISTSLKEGLKIAYTHYKLGDYRQTALILNRLWKDHESDRSIHFYVLAHNLNKLAYIIASYYPGDTEMQDMAKIFDAIDLDEVRVKCSTRENKLLLDYIHNIEFCRDEFVTLYESAVDIKDYSIGQKAGLTSSTEQLLETYFSTHELLNSNSIVYDLYSQYESMSSLFLESLLLSYHSSKDLIGKLNHFNDGLLTQFLPNKHTDHLLTLVRDKDLKEITYLPESTTYTLADNFISLLDHHQELVDSLQKLDVPIPFFWDTYTRYINNALFILSYFNFPKERINSVANALHQFVSVQDKIHFHTFEKRVIVFLWHNRDKIKSDIRMKYFLLGIHYKEFHNEDYSELLKMVSKRKNHPIDLQNSDFTELLRHFVADCPLCREPHPWTILGDLYLSLKREDQRSQIKEAIKSSLALIFNSERYHLAVLFEIIPANKKYTQLYVEEIRQLLQNGISRRIQGQRYFFSDSRIDRFLNFIFRCKMEIPPSIRPTLAQLGEYYAWLCDMEHFDYNRFDPDWLHVHYTTHYKRKFRQCKSLKAHLLSLIEQEKSTEDLEKTFVQIYYLPTPGKKHPL